MIGRVLFYKKLIEVSPRWYGQKVGTALSKVKPWNLLGKRKIGRVHNKVVSRMFGNDSGNRFWNLLLGTKVKANRLDEYYKTLGKYSKK